jgi:hypothetical protein
MVYNLLVTEGCSVNLKQFKTKYAMDKFLNSFKKKYGSLDDGADNYVWLGFKGKVLKMRGVYVSKSGI